MGLAGLGTVGASVVRLIERQRDGARGPLRPSDRGRGGDRALARQEARRRSQGTALGQRSDRARARSRDRRVRRTDGRRGRSGQGAVEAALKAGKSVVTANKALLARHGVALAPLAEKQATWRSISKPAVGGAIPIVKTLREGLVGNSLRARLRHPQRHLQLHPHAHGAGEAVVRRLPARRRSGSAMPRPIRPSTSRATTPRRSSRSWRASPSAPRSIRTRSMSKAFPRSRRPISRPPTNSAIASSFSAWRSEHRQGHRAARASDHGAASSRRSRR